MDYVVCDAHEMTILPGDQADLVVIAQALHWCVWPISCSRGWMQTNLLCERRLDRPRFYQEVLKLLKPGGTFAIITYDFGVLETPDSLPDSSESTCEQLNSVWRDNFHGKLGPYWSAPRKLVDDQYRGGFRCISR